MHDVHRVGAIRLPIRSSLLNACRLNPIMNIDTSSLPLADILGEKDEKSNEFNYLRKVHEVLLWDEPDNKKNAFGSLTEEDFSCYCST